MIKTIRDDKYAELVNFKKSRNNIIHRWFNIKEGYSEELIFLLFDEFNLNRKGYIVDFFNGSGTTSLAAKNKGYKYRGFEVSPFLYKLSLVKTSDYSNYDINKIKRNFISILENYREIKNIDKIELSITKKVFGKKLKKMMQVRSMIFKISEEKIRNFFLIGFISILEEIGIAKKDGNGLKYPKNKISLDFINTFESKIELMISDIENSVDQKNRKDSYIVNCDSRNIDKKELSTIKSKASLVVYSPPYANCFDYSEVYKLELWLGGFVNEYSDLKKIRAESLSSHLNKNLDSYNVHPLIEKDIKILSQKKIWSPKILKMLSGYFYDMEKVILNSYNSLMKGGYCVIIVGNSAYGGHIIETDIILSKIALDIGFTSSEVRIARKLRASSQQAKSFKKDNSLRESVIILKK